MRLLSRKLIVSLLLLLATSASVILYAQQRGTPNTLVVKTDANGYLIVTNSTQTPPISQGTFSSRNLRTDGNGNLGVYLAGGGASLSYPLNIPSSTCAAPSMGLSIGMTTGIAFSAVPSIINCVSGIEAATFSNAGLVMSTNSGYNIGWGSIRFVRDGANAISIREIADGQAALKAFGNATNYIQMSHSGSNGFVWTSGANALFLSTNAGATGWQVGTAGQWGNQSSIPTFTGDVKLIDSAVIWNSGATTFTGWKLNVTDTASNAASLLMTLQVGGADRFFIFKNGAFSNSMSNLGTSSSDGAILVNGTAATAGNQQISPRVRWTGQGWKTDATAGSQTVDFVAEVLPIQGTANPSASWRLRSQINGGGYADRVTVSSDNVLSTGALNAGVFVSLSGSMITSSVDPTISSGFGTSPSISAPTSTAAFRITVGTGGTANNGVIGLPAATTGWNCFAVDTTTPNTGHDIKQTASTTTSATLTNYNNAGTATAWTASDVLVVSCFAY